MHERLRKETPKPVDPDYVKRCRPKSHLNWRSRWVSWRSLIPCDERFWHVNGHLAMRSWERRKRYFQHYSSRPYTQMVASVCPLQTKGPGLTIVLHRQHLIQVVSRVQLILLIDEQNARARFTTRPEMDDEYVDKRCQVWVQSHCPEMCPNLSS